eukprot:c9553_g1_i1 orf=55-627(-)
MVSNGKEACSSSSSSGDGFPFFTRPFGTMFGGTGGLFGPAGFAGMRSLLLLRMHASPLPSSDRSRVSVKELLDDFEETPESKASNYQQHIVELPHDVVILTHQSNNQLRHENSCQASSGEKCQFCETDSSYQKCRMCHAGFENFNCSVSAPKSGLHEVCAMVKKRDTSCTESAFATGYLEPPRKQSKISL